MCAYVLVVLLKKKFSLLISASRSVFTNSIVRLATSSKNFDKSGRQTEIYFGQQTSAAYKFSSWQQMFGLGQRWYESKMKRIVIPWLPPRLERYRNVPVLDHDLGVPWERRGGGGFRSLSSRSLYPSYTFVKRMDSSGRYYCRFLMLFVF